MAFSSRLVMDQYLLQNDWGDKVNGAGSVQAVQSVQEVQTIRSEGQRSFTQLLLRRSLSIKP
jgi:hypothetical protein